MEQRSSRKTQNCQVPDVNVSSDKDRRNLIGLQQFLIIYKLQIMLDVEVKVLNRIFVIDNCGRRFCGDRRAFSYGIHLPERRSCKDRRRRFDRRVTYRYKENEIESRRKVK